MTNPIHPEDHSLPKFVYETDCDVWAGVQFDALTEAVHQTFERDAEWWQDRQRYAATPARSREADPATEIDRTARLIVDGEYRARAVREKGQANG